MNQNRLFTQLIATFVLIFSTLTIPEESRANHHPDYFCAKLHGVYRTFVNSARGRLMIISYFNNPPRNWTNRDRCIEISQRFQAHYDHGNLQYIGTGYLNNQPVLCAVIYKGDPCRENNILLTLTNGRNPTEEARRLLNRGFYAGRTLDLSGDEKLEIYRDGQTYYNLNLILEMAQPVEEAVILVD